MATTVRATLDRIVDGEHAVLLVEGDEGVTDEIVLTVDDFPDDGQREGSVFDVTIADSEVSEIVYLPDESAARREAAQDRLDRLSSPLSERSRDDE